MLLRIQLNNVETLFQVSRCSSAPYYRVRSQTVHSRWYSVEILSPRVHGCFNYYTCQLSRQIIHVAVVKTLGGTFKTSVNTISGHIEAIRRHVVPRIINILRMQPSVENGQSGHQDINLVFGSSRGISTDRDCFWERLAFPSRKIYSSSLSLLAKRGSHPHNHKVLGKKLPRGRRIAAKSLHLLATYQLVTRHFFPPSSYRLT